MTPERIKELRAQATAAMEHKGCKCADWGGGDCEEEVGDLYAVASALPEALDAIERVRALTTSYEPSDRNDDFQSGFYGAFQAVLAALEGKNGA